MQNVSGENLFHSTASRGDNYKHTFKHRTVHKGLTCSFHRLKYFLIVHSPVEWTVPWIHMTCVRACVRVRVTGSVFVCARACVFS